MAKLPTADAMGFNQRFPDVSTPTPDGNGAGNGYFQPPIFPPILAGVQSAVTTCMRLLSRGHSNAQPARLGSSRQPPLIPSDIVLPPTCSNPARISAPCRSYLGMRMFPPRWFILMY